MAFVVTAPEHVGFSRDRIVWSFQDDQAGATNGSLAQNVIQITGPVAEGTRIPIRWGDTVLSIRAATSPDQTGAQFPAGDGSAAYVATLATWLAKNYFLNEGFSITAAEYQGSPSIYFYARENGLGYDFNAANFPGGKVLNQVPGVAGSQPLNPSVYVEVFLGNESGLSFTRIYKAPQSLDKTHTAQFDVGPILHPHLKPEIADYALPEAARCIYSTRRYYLRYAYAGGEQFSIGQVAQTDTHVVTMGGFSELDGGPVSVESTFKGATAAADRLLMVQDRTRWVRVDEPLYVSWINWRDGGLKNIHARATLIYTDDTTETTNTATIDNVAQYDRLRFAVGFGQLNLAASAKQVKEYTVQLRDDTGFVSEPLRCLVDVSYRSYVRYFGHLNSYGALEVVKTFGKGSSEWNLFRETAEQVLPYDLKSTDAQFLDWNLSYQESFEVATGFLPKRQQSYFLDFFLSPLKHRIVNGVGYAVNVVTESVSHGTDGDNLFGFAFKFQYSRRLDAVTEQDLETVLSPSTQVPPGIVSPGTILIPTPGSDWLGVIDPYPIQGSSNPVASGGVNARLAAKQDIIATGNSLQYLRGDGTLANFATAVNAVSTSPSVPSYAKSLISKEKVLSDLRSIATTLADYGITDGLSAPIGAVNYLPRFVTANTMAKSSFYQDPATGWIGLNKTAPQVWLDVAGSVQYTGVLFSRTPLGTAPIITESQAVCFNLNADFLDGQHGAFYQNADNLNAGVFPITRHPASGIVAGSYTKLTVNSYGHATAGESPTTLAGYGITDGLSAPIGAVNYLPRFVTANTMAKSSFYQDPVTGWIGLNKAAPQVWLDVAGSIQLTGGLFSRVAQGSPPITSISQTICYNINADFLDGQHGAFYQNADNLNAGIFPITRHPASGIVAGSYTKLTVNSYGHATAGESPTTLAGYGITDGLSAPIGAVNYLPRFVTANTMAKSSFYQDPVTGWIGLNKAAPQVWLDVAGSIQLTGGLFSRVAQGSPPITSISQTICYNINADFLDGQHGAFYQNADNLNAGIFPITRHPASGIVAGSYTKLTVNSYGHATAGESPTTLAGYGITDALSLDGTYNNPTWLGSLDWAKITGVPTYTLSNGSPNYLPVFGANGALVGNSAIYQHPSSGNIGIGRTTPEYKLQVNGDVGIMNYALSSGEYGDGNNLSRLVLGENSKFSRNSILMDSFFDHSRLEIGAAKHSHLSSHAAIIITAAGAGVPFEAAGKMLIISRAINSAGGWVEILTGADRKRTAKFTDTGDIIAHQYLVSSVTNASVEQPFLRLVGADEFGYLKASVLAADIVVKNSDNVISSLVTFNSVAPTSTVPNSTNNPFELATVDYVNQKVGAGGTGGGSYTDPTPSWVNAITQGQILDWNDTPRASVAHANPFWVGSLPLSKITGASNLSTIESLAQNSTGIPYKTEQGLWGMLTVSQFLTRPVADGLYQAASNRLNALSSQSYPGIVVSDGGSGYFGRTMIGSSRIVITNASGIAGNPVFDLVPTGIAAGITNHITHNIFGQITSIRPLNWELDIVPIMPPDDGFDSRPPQFSSVPPLRAIAGTAYSFQLDLGPYKTSYHNINQMTIKAILTKPAWLVGMLNGLQAALSGTPPTSGQFELVLQVQDDNGNESTVVVPGIVDEPGTTAGDPVTITARLFNMATGESVAITHGGEYPFYPRWNIRFDQSGPHNQIKQSISGGGQGPFGWGPENAAPGGVTTQQSSHWVFGPNNDAQNGGWGPGAYTFSPQALLAGAVKAQPVFNFTQAVNDSGGGGGGGGGNNPSGSAYFYNDSNDTAVGEMLQSGSTFALPPTWDVRFDLKNTDADGVRFVMEKAGANNPVFAGAWSQSLTPFANSQIYLFDIGDNTDFESPETPFQEGQYTIRFYPRKNGVDLGTVYTYPINIAKAASTQTALGRQIILNASGSGFESNEPYGMNPEVKLRYDAFTNMSWQGNNFSGITAYRPVIKWREYEKTVGNFEEVALRSNFDYVVSKGHKIALCFWALLDADDTRIPNSEKATLSNGSYRMNTIPGLGHSECAPANYGATARARLTSVLTNLANVLADYREHLLYVSFGIGDTEEYYGQILRGDGQVALDVGGYSAPERAEWANFSGNQPIPTPGSAGSVEAMYRNSEVGKLFFKFQSKGLSDLHKHMEAPFKALGLPTCGFWADAGSNTQRYWYVTSQDFKGIFSGVDCIYSSEGGGGNTHTKLLATDLMVSNFPNAKAAIEFDQEDLTGPVQVQYGDPIPQGSQRLIDYGGSFFKRGGWGLHFALAFAAPGQGGNAQGNIQDLAEGLWYLKQTHLDQVGPQMKATGNASQSVVNFEGGGMYEPKWQAAGGSLNKRIDFQVTDSPIWIDQT